MTRLALALAAAPLLLLAGCGGSEDGSAGAPAASPSETACRAYLLGVGGDDNRAVQLLDRANRQNGWENDPINDVLRTTLDATLRAGTTSALPAKDFTAYLALSEAARSAYAAANPDGGPGVTSRTVSRLRKAVDGVRVPCGA